jgi:Leucine-rich repeat (LRR) protein
MIDFYSLQYLELCSAGLEQLPARFAKYVPNLTVLDLSMNRLSDIRPLRKLKYIQRLTLIGNQLTSLSDVTKTVKHFKKMKYLDLR